MAYEQKVSSRDPLKRPSGAGKGIFFYQGKSKLDCEYMYACCVKFKKKNDNWKHV